MPFSSKKHTSLERLLQDRINQDSRPSNFLCQIARGTGATLSECTFFYEKSARHSWESFKIWPLQGFTSKEPGPSLIHQAKPGKQGGLRVQPWNARGLVDVGPMGFRSDVTIGYGPWPGPREEARRGAASATSTPSKIGQISLTPMEVPCVFSSGHLLWIWLEL
jgi:hypothetical protein